MSSLSKRSPLVPPRRECDLGPPVQAYLAEQGYTVRSEVGNCDITAVRGEELVVVELKRQFSTDLLIQATERQRIAESVYVALPVEGALTRRDRYSRRWKGIEHLLKRLELGLILVYFPPESDAPPTLEVVQHPISEPRPRRKPKARRTILREISGRQAGDYNVGGTTGRRLMTAYCEQCIYLACCLDRFGPMTPAALRARCDSSPKTQNMLFRNVYGWFERLERGLYGLRAAGRDEIGTNFPGVAEFYRRKVDEITRETDARDTIEDGKSVDGAEQPEQPK